MQSREWMEEAEQTRPVSGRGSAYGNEDRMQSLKLFSGNASRDLSRKVCDYLGIEGGQPTQKSEMIVLQRKYTEGDLKPPAKLRLVELLEQFGNTTEALLIARELAEQHSENSTVARAVERLSG